MNSDLIAELARRELARRYYSEYLIWHREFRTS